VHIGHWCTWQLLLFVRCATIVSLTVFAPRASSGTILEFCSYSYSKFQKSNQILLIMSLFRRIKGTLDSTVHDNFYSIYIVLQLCHWQFLLQEPQVGPYWSSALIVISILNIKLDSAHNVTVSKDQVHIGHFCRWQLLLFRRCATIVSLTLFAPRASSGTILELCSFSYSKFQKSNQILLIMSLFRRIKCTLDTSVDDNFYSLYIALQ
jgi:hypothetical protein